PEIDFDAVAKVAKLAPTLAGEILSVANSMKVGGDQEIKSLKHAAVYVGRQALSDIVLMASIKGFTFNTRVFTQDKFWFDSFICGIIAERIAKDFAPKVVRDEAYVAGCLANIGKALAAIVNPTETDQVCEVARKVENRMNWRRVEAKLGS